MLSNSAHAVRPGCRNGLVVILVDNARFTIEIQELALFKNGVMVGSE